ncbi:metal-binding protein [Peptacetobacter hominis]|uniref:Metal-binding protein n=1 Tax=Peptacetobacter hominis TaxID=2743610 RepID=A0A544QW19_9FIRM|nr:cysteine-rich small domain-containing protein [Peptacetobacter hominis]TQQ84890.1 metal-binding protein [Peptacetobacter hominis]
MSDNYKFFCHKGCEFFPCHKTEDPENFNCLFCYCPLYALGESCGGNFRYTDKGIKDCSNCMLPHKKSNFDYIMSKFQDIVKITSKNSKE